MELAERRLGLLREGLAFVGVDGREREAGQVAEVSRYQSGFFLGL